MAATVIAAMGAMARIYLGQAAGLWRLAAIFWTAIGLGLLVKGPITPMVPLLAFIALAIKDRSIAWARGLKPLVGLAWALALVAPWFILIMIETDGAFLRDSVGRDMLAKVSSGKESHGAPPLTYLGAFWATAWPMAPFAALAAPFVWAQRRSRQIAFLLAWLVPTWIVFELTPTKLPHYVMPLYPAIAIICALAIERLGDQMMRGWRRVVLYWLPAFPIVLVIVALGGAVWLKELPGQLFFFALPIIVTLAYVMARWMAWIKLDALVFATPVLAIAAYLAIYSGVMTGATMNPFALSPRLAQALERAQAANPGCADIAPATISYREPSLVFLTRTDLGMLDAEQAAAFLNEAPCRAVLVESRVETRFREALGQGASVSVSERLQGININGGRKLDIGIYVRGAQP
jgi:4-amino-4-deoxy-L-arabinose transferase-like glycosyltransferase